MAHPNEPPRHEGGLLAPGERASSVRPLLAWSRRHRERAVARVRNEQAAWRTDWCLALPPAEARPLDADAARAGLLQDLAGDAPRGGAVLAAAVGAAAWADWLARMHALTGGHFDAHLPPARTGWEGQLEVALPWWQGTWAVRLTAEAVRQVVPADPVPASPPREPDPLQPAVTALANRVVELRAHFSPLTLTLGELESLRIGDVIPLAQGLHEPVQVLLQPGHEAGGVPLCSAWLGQRQGRLAAELAAHPH